MASQRYYRVSKKNLIVGDVVIERPIEEEPKVREEESAHFDKAWATLGESCKTLLKKYYYEGVQLKEIASTKDKKPTTIRKQKERCLSVLRTSLQKIMRLTNVN